MMMNRRTECESKDHLSLFSGGQATSSIENVVGNGNGSSLIYKRVSSAGALVRQNASPSSIPRPSDQKRTSPLSDTKPVTNDEMQKGNLMDPSVLHQQSEKCQIEQMEEGRKDEKSNGAKCYKPALRNETGNGKEFGRLFGLNDYNELKLRYTAMESAYEADRKKSGILLAKKDAHIGRLQERVASLEQRLEAASKPNTDNSHGLIAERDALLDKVKRLETAFAAEKASWETSFADCCVRLANTERALREKELVLRKPADLPSTVAESPSSSCKDCSYFRRELERMEKSRTDLLREKDQLQQENQRKETVLSELSAEATELRVQLNSLNEECTSLKRRKHQLEEEMMRSPRNGRGKPPGIVADENMFLRRRLNEAQDYFEAMDIESEQQITSLTNQLEDTHSALEQKQRDITLLHNQLKELEHERDKALTKIRTCENNFSRQQDIIEGLREELDRQKDKTREMARERDDLLLRNASLSHEVELFKREAQNQRDEFHAHLADVSRELEQCKVKIREQESAVNSSSDGNAAVKLLNANTKISNLEDSLRDRDTTIAMQQQRLSDMKRALQMEWKSAFDNPSIPISMSMPYGLNLEGNNGASGLSSPFQNIPDQRLFSHFQYLRNVILRFVTSSDYEATQLVRAVGALLCLTPQEEQLVWDTLKWKMSWTPTSKPKLAHTP